MRDWQVFGMTYSERSSVPLWQHTVKPIYIRD